MSGLPRRNFVRIAALTAAALVGGCNGTSVALPSPGPTAAPAAISLYAYSPDDKPLLATYPIKARGHVAPSTILAGSATTFVGGKNNVFAGGIDVAPNGTLYVLDGTRGKLLTFAPRATGNVAPSAIATLPRNSAVGYGAPQYAGFALDTQGNYWTVDRANGNLVRFPLSAQGRTKPSLTLKPEVEEQHLVPGVASTVASDGEGDIYCVCQPDDLALQLYCITEYRVAGVDAPRLIRSFYGILGNLDTQIPSSVLHVNPETNTVYVGIWTPDAILEYPANTPTGPAPRPRYISGAATGLVTAPAAITTDSSGAVYVAASASILVFGKNASGNAAPLRVISDAKHLHFLGQAFGEMLATH